MTRTPGLAILSACLACGACAPQGATPLSKTAPATTTRAVEAPDAFAQRLARLDESMAALREAAMRLPGRSAVEHRARVAAALGGLADVMEQLAGADVPGPLRQQIMILRRSGGRLDSGVEMAVEPTIDAAVRSAAGGLRHIAGELPGEAPLDGAFAGLSAKISELDTVRGPIHQLVTAQAIRQIADIAGELRERMRKAGGAREAGGS